MAQPFPSPIHSMSAIHGCLLCSVAYLLALVPISLVKCFYFTSSSYILTYYSDSRHRDRDTYPRPASELLRNVATCEARTHF